MPDDTELDTTNDKKCSTQKILTGLAKANIPTQYIASTASWLSTAVNTRTFVKYFISDSPVLQYISIAIALGVNFWPYLHQNHSYTKFARKLLRESQSRYSLAPTEVKDTTKNRYKNLPGCWIAAGIKTVFGVGMPIAVTMTDLVGPWWAAVITTAGGVTYLVAQRGVFSPNKLPEKSYIQGVIAAFGSGGSMAGPTMSLVSFMEIVSKKNIFTSLNRHNPLTQILYLSTFSMGLALAPPQANTYFRNFVPAQKNQNPNKNCLSVECILELLLAFTTLPSAMFKALGSINGPMIVMSLLLQFINSFVSNEKEPEWITTTAFVLGGLLIPIIFAQQYTYMVHNRESESTQQKKKVRTLLDSDSDNDPNAVEMGTVESASTNRYHLLNSNSSIQNSTQQADFTDLFPPPRFNFNLTSPANG